MANKRILPDTLNIGGLQWTVEHPIAKWPESEMYEANLAGKSVEATSTIYVRGDYSPEFQRRTLMHEILHMLVAESGINETYQAEGFIDPMANVLFRFLRDNDIDWVQPKPRKGKRKRRAQS